MIHTVLWIVCLSLYGARGDVPSYWMEVEATGYCPCASCTDGDGKTATGRNAWKPGVAVDPAVIPLGSHVDVPGVRTGPNRNGSWLTADDVGGRIKGNKIDVRFTSHAEAREYGRKTIRIRVWPRRK